MTPELLTAEQAQALLSESGSASAIINGEGSMVEHVELVTRAGFILRIMAGGATGLAIWLQGKQ